MSLQRTIAFTLSIDEAAACRRLSMVADDALKDSALARNDLAHVKNVAQRLGEQFFAPEAPLTPPCCPPSPT